MQNEVRVERDSNGRYLAVSREIDASAERVWDVLTDTACWPEWGPSVWAVECADRTIRLGSSGRIKTPFGLELPFEITAYDEFYWSWDVAGLPATGHRVEELADRNGCRVVFSLPLFAVGYVPVCQRALSRIDRLADEGI